MSENKLFEYKSNIQANQSIKNIEIELRSSFVDEQIYSFIVTIKCDNECQVITYQVKHLVADNEENNTLFVDDVIKTIINAIIEHRDYKGKNKVICYGQPPLELMLILYEPMIEKMAKSLNERWTRYDIDDLKQICRMSMVELYNKGYYIHKRLLKKVFEREILMEVRCLKRRGEVISLYTKVNNDNADDEVLTIRDMLEDTDAILEEEELKRIEGEKAIFEEVKSIVIDLIGERRWDMLFRDYSKGHTTNTTRLMLKRLKEQLKAEGYTRNLFNERYH